MSDVREVILEVPCSVLRTGSTIIQDYRCMARNAGDGFLGLELTSGDWLRNHFAAKAPQRIKQIAALPIREGDKVLDLACGPGDYAEQFALLAGPAGHVYAADKDPTHIDSAELRRASSPVREVLSYACHDLSSGALPDFVEGIPLDVVTIFNALFYFDDKISLLKNCLERLRTGGRLMLKDSDYGFFLVSPFDTALQQRVIAAAELDRTSSFDNFGGRTLFKIASQLPGVKISTVVWPYAAHYPLSSAMRFYVSTNLLTLGEQARPNISKADFDEWNDLYDMNNPDAHINSKDFLFLMNEIVVIATKDSDRV